MTLAELIAPLEKQGEVTHRRGDAQVSIASLTDDSRQITPGTLFVAVKGERVDGHAYVRQAVEAGAVALIVQDASSVSDHTVPIVGLRDSRQALGLLAARLHNDPSAHLRMSVSPVPMGKRRRLTSLRPCWSRRNEKSG
jgi:UDP-N-acetylmuramyl tripeptide synthase